MRLKKPIIVSLSFAAVSVLFYSCATPPLSAPVAPLEVASVVDKTTGLKVRQSSKRQDVNRPGIATGWGDEIKSKVNIGSFTRATTQPASVSSLYYNDKEGIKAMTGNWSYKGSGLQKTGNGMIEWGVKSSRGYLKNVHSSGKRFVVGSKEKNYQLVVRNIAHSKLEVVLSVDGLDVLDGKPASLKKRGYIIEPGKTLVVKGFRKSEDAVAAFKFSSVRDSYSSLSNQGSRNVGVIGMAIYTQKGVSPWRYGAQELSNRKGARAFAEAPQVRAR